MPAPHASSRSNPLVLRDARPHRVAVLALDGVVAFDLAVPCTVFGSVPHADATQADAAGAIGAPAPPYEVRVCGVHAARVTTPNGFALEVPHGLRTIAWADTVVVPGLADVRTPVPARALAALRAAHARGARIVSICTGAFVLAEAGLLDGRCATTHWYVAPLLTERFPRVRVDAAVLYVEDRGVYTSAGVAAGIDLCLHLLRQDHGSDVANRVARGMVVAPHRSGGQAQFAEAPVPTAPDGGLERTRRWMLARLAEPLTVDMLARHAAMSRRTFARRFAEETGTTPLQWLVAQRVLLARRLLETTDDPIARVAERAGFGTALGLRQHFGRATGTTPLAYRRTFRGRAA